MQVYGIIGWKNAGKTSLMERLVAEITGRGFTVSTVKHVHHDVDLDQPGKDTWRHRQAGASEVVLASAHRFALMREHRGPEPDLATILARMAPVDLVLVEGYKRDAHRKVEVFRDATGQHLIQPADPLVRAVATDATLPPLPVPVLDLNNAAKVADFILAECGMEAKATFLTSAKSDADGQWIINAAPQAPFDTVIIVDWSASATPSPRKPSPDAIWIGVARATDDTPTYHRTRTEAETHLTALLMAELSAGRRVLLGCDFPFGYPQGTARHLTGTPDPLALWDWLAARITDAPDNTNNRFRVASQINASFPATGPFWGRPAALDLPHLPDRKTCDYAALGLPERRRIETVIPRAQPVWKLYTSGSVGSQTLMGLPMLSRLRHRFSAAVWPFQNLGAALIFAEIYPSLIDPAVAKATAKREIKDAAQVRLLARALRNLSQSGALNPLLTAVPEGTARDEEGWILGAGHAQTVLAALA